MNDGMRSYSDLIDLSFIERFRYLKLNGKVCELTFGHERYLNQLLYRSQAWRSFRNKIVIRDDGCDLGANDRPIEFDKIIIHHLNPITISDIKNKSPRIFDPDNVICCSNTTHQAIHYGNENLLYLDPIERTEFDTCPWKIKG